MVGVKRCIIMAWLGVYLTFTSHANADNSSSYCVTADDKKFCEKVVQGAADWNQAMCMAISEAMKHITSISSSDYRAMIHRSKSATLGKTIDSLCHHSYLNTRERLKESLELARNGDYDSLNLKLSSALTSLEDCSSVFFDLKYDYSSLMKMNRDLNHCIRVCLAVDKSKALEEKQKATQAALTTYFEV
ncbi:PREDICTED: uncharacterized protein LOC109147358 [Ipomoea nil]|uniref:uncharacterized protein LOC109147358 n=1 Tax=Ipomoea nil TaxID=35883 RepID=UPI000901D0E3|nr:PREDICTED: uncharacterized protein LOC109147358 [Ipomoea nil]